MADSGKVRDKRPPSGIEAFGAIAIMIAILVVGSAIMGDTHAARRRGGQKGRRARRGRVGQEMTGKGWGSATTRAQKAPQSRFDTPPP